MSSRLVSADVSNRAESQAASHRPKRVSRACDHCRRLKEKCEWGVPCRRCVHTRRACEFKNVPQYNRDLHRTAESISGTNEELRHLRERVDLMGTILKHISKDVSLETDNLRRIVQSYDNGEAIYQSVDLSQDQQSDDLLVDQETCTINPIKDTTTHYSGEFSYWNFSMKLKRLVEFDQQHSSQAADISGLPLQTPSYWRAGQLGTGSSSLDAAVSCRPPRPIADFLLDIFFQYAEGNLFYVDRDWVSEQLNTLYDTSKQTVSKDAATVSVLLIILAVGTQYTHLESEYGPGGGTTETSGREDEVGSYFYQHAVRLLPEIIETSSLESVQFCLLLGLYALPIDASGLSYVYINLACRLAMQNGMHRRYTGTALGPAAIDTRNRVWWSIHTIERKIALFHGRPLSIQLSDVDAQLPMLHLRDNFTPKVSYMLASVKLGELHEESFRIISRLRDPQQTVTVLNDALVMKRTLESAWASLRISLSNDPEISMALSRAGRHLRLEYCLIRMFIGRPFLLAKQLSGTRYHVPGSRRQQHAGVPRHCFPEDRKDHRSRDELIDDCLLAARDSLETLLALRDNRPGLARASYIEYSSCRASLLVLIAHSIQTRCDDFSDLLQDGLSMIRSMAAAGDSARSEILLIEALEGALNRFYTFRVPSQEKVQLATVKTGYDGFRKWQSNLSGAGVGSPHVPRNPEHDMSTSGTSSQHQPEKLASDVPSEQFIQTPTSYEGVHLTHDSHCSPLDMDLAFLQHEGFTVSSEWPGMLETQVLEEFLAMSQ